MTVRRSTRRRDAQIAFDALSIEGGLISPAWLNRVAQLAAPGQEEADYGVFKGLNIRDEIGRYWRVAQAHWMELQDGMAAQADERALSERFLLSLLRECLGFTSIQSVDPIIIGERLYPVGFLASEGRVPVVIAPFGIGIDTTLPTLGDGSRKRSAFGLAQEYLNAAGNALWGLASDGSRLRIVRDNASLTRPAWIEADLSRIFTEKLYPDFAALWLLCHASRFGKSSQPTTESPLETWREGGREEGTLARKNLRTGVEAALSALGQGFLAHPANATLRAALHDGSLTRNAYFGQLLRLVYRLIFVLTLEERELLHPKNTPEAARTLYAEGYGLKRLRERSVRRSAHDLYSDLWEGTKIVLRGLATGEPLLGLPALAGLFAVGQCPDLDKAKLENRSLLLTMFRLSWLKERSGLSRVNWRDMGPEELGSVYESLLELVPQISEDGRTFGFAGADESKGNARKTTGSYYTPESLVQVLLDSALEPVIQQTIAGNPSRPIQALLKLAVVDPACGSGHFLLAAARRIATHIARLKAEGTPSTDQYRDALRKVIGRCIYGVDLNPMAVELCRVALWMEAVLPGQPLTFLDAHIRHGNALVGATSELMAKGIPDSAWEPIEGDDKEVTKRLKKANKAKSEVSTQMALLGVGAATSTDELARRAEAVDEADDDTLEALTEKERKHAAYEASAAAERRLADLWCAAFVWPKTKGEEEQAAPVASLWERVKDAPQRIPSATIRITEELAQQYRFFHWHLAFSPVFKRGGFDVVLGNPPWERVKLQEQEFFAPYNDAIAKAANAAARKRLIAALPMTDPELWHAWCIASREAEGQSHFVRQSGRYPLCGKGDINTYALFAEHNRAVLGLKGRAGFIVPTGIATDDTTKEYFGVLINRKQLSRFYSFENEELVFPGVHHAFRFALLTIDSAGTSTLADLVFFARQVTDLADPERHFTLSPTDFATLNPNTRTCPTFRSRRDADINLALYRRAGVLWREGEPDGNPWGLSFMAMLHMANDSGLFRPQTELEAAGWAWQGNRFIRGDHVLLPLIEAKMVHHFDHRFGTYEGQTEAGANQGKLPELDDAAHADPHQLTHPRYWVDSKEVAARLDERWSSDWLLGWRDICRSTDQRTVIASLIPRAAVGHTTPLMFTDRDPRLVAALYANLCSFALDYAARQKIGGTHLTYGYLKQFPVLTPTVYDSPAPWSVGVSVRDWLLPRVLELTYTAWDLQPFAQDCGYDGAPFRWDPVRRALLRAELDAAFFHLYGLSRDDTSYILDTFPVVARNDERKFQEYRTKRLILEAYDDMTKAASDRRAYVSPFLQPNR